MKLKGWVVNVACLATVLAVVFGAIGAEAKETKWRLNITNPSLETTVGQAMLNMAKNVKERTKGALDIQVFPGGALGYNPFTVHRAVKGGALEMAETCMPYISEEPVYKVYSQICLFGDAAEANKAIDVAWEDLQKATAKHNQKLLMTYAYPNDNLATVSKPMSTIESWKGEKIRAWNPFVAKWLSAVGAVPQVIPFNEKYTALAQKIIEGNFAGPRGMLDTGDFEVTKYYNMWGVTSAIYIVIINKPMYDGLSPEVRAVLDEECSKTQATLRKELAESVEGDLKTLKEKHGMTIVDVPKAEFEKARKAATPLWEAWVAEATPEAKAVMAKVRKALGH